MSEEGIRVRPTVFIHTNERQLLGAYVGRYALRRNSATPDAFDVRLIHTDDDDVVASAIRTQETTDGPAGGEDEA